MNEIGVSRKLAVMILSLGFTFAAGNAFAQKTSAAEVIAASNAFYAALSGRDLGAMK